MIFCNAQQLSVLETGPPHLRYRSHVDFNKVFRETPIDTLIE